MRCAEAGPDFLIVGAMRAGTTLVYDLLRQHPSVYMPEQKELHFFSVRGKDPWKVPLEGATVRICRWDDYARFFEDAPPGALKGEASTSYLYTPWAAEAIRQFHPDVKLVCVLRDPVERAFSHFLWLVRRGLEGSRTFEEALQREPERMREGSDFGRYVWVGRYYEQLRRLYRHFRREQILVVFFEDLMSDPVRVAQKVYRHLGAPDSFAPIVRGRRNPSGTPRWRWLELLGKSVRPLGRSWPGLARLGYRIRDWNLQRPHLSPDTEAALREAYRQEILALEGLLGRPLSRWRASSGGRHDRPRGAGGLAR